jgi:hypothetical protein
VGTYCKAAEATDDMAHALNSLRICNIYCFSAATVAVSRGLNVTSQCSACLVQYRHECLLQTVLVLCISLPVTADDIMTQRQVSHRTLLATRSRCDGDTIHTTQYLPRKLKAINSDNMHCFSVHMLYIVEETICERRTTEPTLRCYITYRTLSSKSPYMIPHTA